VMMPLLLFPLVVPALMAASSATSRLLEGDPQVEAPTWILFLAIFDAIQWSMGAALYGKIFED